MVEKYLRIPMQEKTRMIKFIFIFILLSLSLQAESLKDIVFEDAVVSEVTSIYDGDTFRANIKDYPPIVGQRMAVRVSGIDTPEIKGKCEIEKALARKAKQQTEFFLRGAKIIELRNIKRGKYFRLVADVFVDEISLSEILIDSKLAVSYDGGTKTKNWCK